MKCPCCGSRVPEGAIRCPRCRAALDVTQKISLEGASWCPSCGALVAPGATSCPKCGADLADREPPQHPVRDIGLPEIGDTGVLDAEDGSDDTGVIARIESAIPPEDGSSSSARRDRIPRPRAFVLAALLAILVVGGSVLLITHPWDPTSSQRATEPADTSMSGYPGFLEFLTGQDRGSATSSTSDGDSESEDEEEEEPLTPLEAIEQAFDELSELAEEVDASEALLRTDGISGDDDARSAGLSEAGLVSIEVSNLIASAQDLDDDDGAYTDAIANLVTLGNWLRNRCDALTEAWQLSVDSSDPAADEASILAPVEAASVYATLFEQNVDEWRSELSSS